MSSPARINASRASGAKSRGPKTTEGKAISSRNAVKHNILSEANPGPEDLADLAEGRALLTARNRPTNQAEAELVETLALARWRGARTRAIGIACFNDAIRARVQQSGELASAPVSVRIAHGFRDLVNNSSLYQLTNRYETSYDGQYTRALEELEGSAASPRKKIAKRT